MTLLGADALEVDALVTDRYLDSLLAARDLASLGGSGGNDRAATGSTGSAADRRTRSRLDGAVRLASERLTRDLPRFHPSFRFEERLAVRLAEAAAAMRLSAAAGAEGSIRAIPAPLRDLPESFDPLADDPDDGDRGPRFRPLLVGGAVAASALSLAGAAFVAWRRSRGGGSPMARAARAAHAMRGRPA